MCDGKACDTCAKNGCTTTNDEKANAMKVYQAQISGGPSGMFSFSGKDIPNTEDIKSAIDKLFSDNGWKDVPTMITPAPDPGDVPQRVPDFVVPEDKLLVWLATLMYKPLPVEIPGATLNTTLTNSRIGVWTNATTAYVAFRGTDIAASDRAGDLLDDLAIATGVGCDISIVAAGVQVVTALYNTGYNDIQLAGHSLGGRGALCCGSFPGISKVVVINAAAPFVNLLVIGPGEEKATHYHIFGDLISSHLQGAKNVRVRVGIEQFSQRNNSAAVIMMETLYQVNWLDPYYHSTDRFLAQDYWQYSTPQEEQDSLEKFFFDSNRAALELLSLLTSTAGLPFAALIKTRICQNVIPGAQKFRYCVIETSVAQTILNIIMKALGFIAGGIAGFITGGPGKVIGGASAGAEAASGNLGPLTKLLFPGLDKLTALAQGMVRDLVTIIFNAHHPKDVNIEDIKVQIIDTIGPRLPQIGGPEEIPIPGMDSSTTMKGNSYLENRILMYLRSPKDLSSTGLQKSFLTIPEFNLDNKLDNQLDADGERLPLVNSIKNTVKTIVNKKAEQVKSAVKDKVTSTIKSKTDKVKQIIKEKAYAALPEKVKSIGKQVNDAIPEPVKKAIRDKVTKKKDELVQKYKAKAKTALENSVKSVKSRITKKIKGKNV